MLGCFSGSFGRSANGRSASGRSPDSGSQPSHGQDDLTAVTRSKAPAKPALPSPRALQLGDAAAAATLREALHRQKHDGGQRVAFSFSGGGFAIAYFVGVCEVRGGLCWGLGRNLVMSAHASCHAHAHPPTPTCTNRAHAACAPASG
jgi:hypothetical protein